MAKEIIGCKTCKKSFYLNKKERDDFFYHHPEATIACPYCNSNYTQEELSQLKMYSGDDIK